MEEQFSKFNVFAFCKSAQLVESQKFHLKLLGAQQYINK